MRIGKEATMRSGTGHKLAIRASIKLALLAAASSAGAQEAAKVETLEEIVVTATGTHISGFDAPSPLTTVSEEQLKSKAVQRISEIIAESVRGERAERRRGTTMRGWSRSTSPQSRTTSIERSR